MFKYKSTTIYVYIIKEEYLPNSYFNVCQHTNRHALAIKSVQQCAEIKLALKSFQWVL